MRRVVVRIAVAAALFSSGVAVGVVLRTPAVHPVAKTVKPAATADEDRAALNGTWVHEGGAKLARIGKYGLSGCELGGGFGSIDFTLEDIDGRRVLAEWYGETFELTNLLYEFRRDGDAFTLTLLPGAKAVYGLEPETKFLSDLAGTWHRVKTVKGE